MSTDILFYDRQTKQTVKETVLGDAFVKLAYNTPARHVLSWPLFKHAFASRLLGWFANRPSSVKRIAKTINELHINMEEVIVPVNGFKNFNDFFSRRFKAGARPFPQDTLRMGSPADCRLFAWQTLDEDTCIPVKGASFTVPELFGPSHSWMSKAFYGGSLCVCRLCPADYHRYHYPDDGLLLISWPVKGQYHSVNPLALRQNLNVFATNYRTVSILHFLNFGKVAFIEVGAFGVGSINQTNRLPVFRRGSEKGYFTFGGSTIIMVFEPRRIVFDDDLLEHTKQNIETRVLAGEPIASGFPTLH